MNDIDVPMQDNSFVWTDARLLGFTPMDDTHKEFYEVALRLVICTDTNALAAIEEFEQHAVSHFEQEEEWMNKTNFPPRKCHIAEHEGVLKSVREVRGAIEDGRAGCALAQDIGLRLFQWFPGHADYMDSALAAWMTKQAMGGKPVVFRRNI
jgi:hemerythrin-like metal-binding protein